MSDKAKEAYSGRIPPRQQAHDCRFSVMKVWRSEWPKNHCPFCGETLPPEEKTHQRTDR